MPADCRDRLEGLKACLNQRGLRMTVQRQVVFCALLERDLHPSADEVRRRARRTLPDISLATVYAVLDLLEDLGEVMAVTTTAGKRYDSRRPLPHPHLICTRCHAVADLEMGGGKSVIIGDSRTQKTPELFRAFGRAVDTLGGI